MRREPDINFLTVKPSYFALTIPPEALLIRAMDFVESARGTDAGETMSDLILALARQDDFNIADLWLLPENERQLAMGMLHHVLISGRLKRCDLEDAAIRMHRPNPAGGRSWRY